MEKRAPSLGEEIANSVSHGVGCLAALVATPFLVLTAARRGGAIAIVGASVFAGTMVVLYLASTLYHALPRNRGKRVFRVIDHSAIFLLIAGTYTPFTLGVLRGAWGWTLLGVVWGLAVLGITMKSVGGIRVPPALDHAVCRHGLAGADRDSTAVASRAGGRLAVADRWRPRVHLRHRVLCGGARAIRPFRVACVRPDGHGVSLLCRAVVRGLTSVCTPQPIHALRFTGVDSGGPQTTC